MDGQGHLTEMAEVGEAAKLSDQLIYSPGATTKLSSGHQ